MDIDLVRVVEYSDFFHDEAPINIQDVLKMFDRTTLVKTSAVLTSHYGNMSFPNDRKTLFSKESEKHVDYLDSLCEAYFKRIGLKDGEKVMLLTLRTVLELWRNVFAIPTNEFRGTIQAEDEKLMLFKVLLTLNEKIMDINGSDKEEAGGFSPDELIFLNRFLTNDCNHDDIGTVMRAQMHYFMTLVEYIPKSDVLRKATEVLFERWEISSWQEYYATILLLLHVINQYQASNEGGLCVITPKKIQDTTGLFSQSLLDCISIDEDAYIPYDANQQSRENNVDYRVFRSKPIVRLKGGEDYVVMNSQLLCERLYNSLYFDLAPLINGKEGSVGYFDYNKDFVERVLFRNAMFGCVNKWAYTIPSKKDVDSTEVASQPDFYVRSEVNLLLMECKAIKMNGDIRDKGDYRRMLHELRQKLALKTENLDSSRRKATRKDELIGVGQLLRHIDAIEESEFEWDTSIPDEVCYYPILVLEDIRLLQPGLLKILNKWLKELVTERFPKIDLSKIACKPVVAVSINTLFLHGSLIRRIGLHKLIDAFLNKEAKVVESGTYYLSATADFEAYMRRHASRKSSSFVDEITEWLKK